LFGQGHGDSQSVHECGSGADTSLRIVRGKTWHEILEEKDSSRYFFFEYLFYSRLLNIRMAFWCMEGN